MFNQNLKMYNQNIEYLNNVIDVAESYIKDKEYIGIFGVSIAGIWLSEIIINYIEIQEGQELFFAYGDIDILNRKIGVIDLPIYNLENIPKQATVFLPFPKFAFDWIKRKYKNRYDNIEFIDFFRF